MPSLFSAILLATSILGADALELLQPRNDGSAPKVVAHEFHRRHIPDRLKQIEADRRRMQKRDATKTVDVELENEEALYIMNASLGTPAQNFQLHIDTGSSDLWVNSENSEFCQQNAQACQTAGAYAPNSSSTYEYVDSMFKITYVDGSGASGDYASDRFAFGDVEIDSLQFGIGYQASKSVGVLGIGYAAYEIAASYGESYSNLPMKLVESGRINTNAYSLWLNDLDASQGEILFGGVNTEKYDGALQTVPVISESGGVYAELIIALTAVGANGNVGSISNTTRHAALLDSGTSLMYLPNDIADAIFSAVGARWDAAQGAALVDCALASSQETLDLTFSEPTIRIPMDELVLSSGPDTCILGVSKNSGSNVLVLGDTFLRSAYVVYDLQNNEISLAQTNFNSTGGTIQEIMQNQVPSATEVQNPVTEVPLSSGAAASSESENGSSRAGVLSAAVAALAAVGAAVVLLA